jgi:hypothetical protein
MAAIAGFARGFAGGAKLRSELDDAKERRGLMALQAQQTQLGIDSETEKKGARAFAASVIKGYQEGDESLGFVRGEDGTYDPNNPANLRRYYDLSETSAAQVAVAMGQSPQKAVGEVRDLRTKGFQENVNSATNFYRLGDFTSGDNMLKKAYSMVNDGQSFLGSAPVEGDPNKVALRYRVDKTGEEKEKIFSRDELTNTLLPMALNAPDAALLNVNMQKLAQSRTEFDALQVFRKAELDLKDRQLQLDGRKADGLMRYYSQMGSAAITRANADNKSIDLQRTTNALNNQLSSVTTLLGLQKNFDPSRASDAEIADHRNKLDTANTAMFLIKEGIDNNELKIDAPQAIRLAQAAENVPFAQIQRAGSNMFFTEIEGVRVPLSMTPSQYRDLAKVNGVNLDAPKPAQPAQPARPGITPPPEPAPARSGRGIPTKPTPEQQAAALDAKMAEYESLKDLSDRRSASRRATLERELKAAGRL